jgi:hypothetical protein
MPSFALAFAAILWAALGGLSVRSTFVAPASFVTLPSLHMPECLHAFTAGLTALPSATSAAKTPAV